jgi:hypothetical protein
MRTSHRELYRYQRAEKKVVSKKKKGAAAVADVPERERARRYIMTCVR